MKNLKEIPDINFRNRLKRLFTEAFENELLDVNNEEVVNCKKLSLCGLNIKDLTGIEYFVNLEKLDCSYNRLTTLPNLPETLKDLNCYNNNLTSLPNLPGALKDLHCSNNKLTTLPKLPGTLKNLWCSENSLTSLPNLPDRLGELWCHSNSLTSLPVLPITLEYLNCYYNNLTSLPNLPDTLEVLLSNNNMLPPTILPKNLKDFYWSICYRNKKDQIEGECLDYVLIK